MNVTIETTKNPDILKFVCKDVLVSGSYEFETPSQANVSPIAQQLLQYPFVKKVYITANFVGIEKIETIDWADIADEIQAEINQYITDGKEIVIASEQKKIPVTVYAEMTPNPNVMKFVANLPLMDGLVEYKNIDEAKASPVATALFGLTFVKEVFISENYISITKNNQVEWTDVTQDLRQYITDFIHNGKAILSEEIRAAAKDSKAKPERIYTDIELEIKNILEEYVKPAVAGDGGNIELINFDETTKTAKMLLQGACSGCPSSTMTLKSGIETMLKDMLPGKVEYVEAING